MNVLSAKVNITLHANQCLIHESKARHKIIKAGKRFGKTKWALFEVCQAAGLKPRSVMWYIAPSFRMAKQIAWHDLKWILPKQLIKRTLETELTIELVNEAKIQLIGADNEDALRGPKLDGVVMDEAAYLKEYIWPAIIQGQLLGSNGAPSGFAYFISSPNSKGINWFTNFHAEAERKMKAGDPDWAAWYFNIYDNPTLNPVEIEKLKDNTPDDTWEVEYMARESALSGLWFPEYSDKDHRVELEPKGTLVRALDWGIQHPTVCLWVHVDLEAKHVHVSEEFVRSDLVISESAEAIKARTGNRPVEWNVIDPSTAKRNSQTGRSDKDEFARYGISCVPGDNRDRGYDIVKMFLKKKMLTVSPKCKNLLYQLKNLQREDKEGDDCTDALRYALVRIHDSMHGMNVFEAEAQAKPAPGSDAYLKALEKRRECNFNNPWMFPEEKAEPMSWLMQEAFDA